MVAPVDFALASFSLPGVNCVDNLSFFVAANI
jgi:hypothetical protein